MAVNEGQGSLDLPGFQSWDLFDAQHDASLPGTSTRPDGAHGRAPTDPCPDSWQAETSPAMRDPAEAELQEVWERVLAHQGRTFQTLRGVQFTFVAVADAAEPAVVVREKSITLTRADLSRALPAWPVTGPGDLPHPGATASYVWAVLDDPRILGGSQL